MHMFRYARMVTSNSSLTFDTYAICFRYKEHTFAGALELRDNVGALAAQAAFSQPIGSAGVVEVPLVTVKTPQHVPAEFGFGSSPCTVEITRQPLNTLLCNAVPDLGESLCRVQVCQ